MVEEYLNDESAQKDAIRLVARKLKEGYVELAGGDGSDAIWIDEKALAKSAKSDAVKEKKEKSAPAKPKEKRVPIELIFNKSELEIQKKFDGDSKFSDLKILASHLCEGNFVAESSEVNDGIKYLGHGYLSVVSKSWSEVTDLFNLNNGTVCRLAPPEAERRVAAVLADNNYIYALAIKGFMSESRNLVKYDIDTKEIVWTCSSSSSSIKPKFTQDDEYIYGSDVKMLYIISKMQGKTISKIEISPKMNPAQKMYSNTAKRFVKPIVIGSKKMVLIGSLLDIALVDIAESQIIWKISFKQYDKIMAHYILNDKLYMLDSKKKLFVINISSGAIENKIDIKSDIELERASNFYSDEEQLCVVLRNKEGNRTLLSINPHNLEYTVFNYPESVYHNVGKLTLFDPYEVIKNGVIISSSKNKLFTINKSGEVLSSLVLPESEGDVKEFIVQGDYIYLAQRRKNGESESSILYQIK